MARIHMLTAVGIAVVGSLATIIAVLATSGGAQILAATTGVTLTAYAIMFPIYFSQREEPRSQPVATPEPVADVTVKPTEPVANVTVNPTPTATISQKGYYDFKGDVHDIIDVEGIGPVYAEKLIALGIETTAELCFADAEVVAKRIDAPAKTVRKWQAMAELAKVNGIGKQYAEALVRAGVMGIDELKRRSATRIADQVTEYLQGLDNNVLGQSVTTRRVENWQAQAKKMRRVRQTAPELAI